MGADGPRARQAKSKARLTAYEKLLEDERLRDRSVEIQIPARPEARRPGRRGDDVKKGYGDKLLVEDMSFRSRRAGSSA